MSDVNNCSPSVNNGSHNGIHRRQQVAMIYELTNNIIMDNSVALCQFIMTRIILFSYSYTWHKINDRKTCTCLASFDGHPHKSQKLIYKIYIFVQVSKLKLVQINCFVKRFNGSTILLDQNNYSKIQLRRTLMYLLANFIVSICSIINVLQKLFIGSKIIQ